MYAPKFWTFWLVCSFRRIGNFCWIVVKFFYSSKCLAFNALHAWCLCFRLEIDKRDHSYDCKAISLINRFLLRSFNAHKLRFGTDFFSIKSKYVLSNGHVFVSKSQNNKSPKEWLNKNVLEWYLFDFSSGHISLKNLHLLIIKFRYVSQLCFSATNSKNVYISFIHKMPVIYWLL